MHDNSRKLKDDHKKKKKYDTTTISYSLNTFSSAAGSIELCCSKFFDSAQSFTLQIILVNEARIENGEYIPLTIFVMAPSSFFFSNEQV